MTEPPKKLRHLPDRLGDVVEWPIDEARVQRLWKGTRQRMAGRRPALLRRPETIIAAAAVVAAVVFAARLAYRMPPEPGPAPFLRLAGGGVPGDCAVAADAPARRWTFEDGSTVTLRPGSRLLTLRNEADTFGTELQSGRARFSVVPGGPRRWRIRAGPVTVDVLGTEFVVEHRRSHVSVEVVHGAVEVSGPSLGLGEQRVLAGESLRVPRGPARAASTPAATPPPSSARPARTPPSARPASPSSTARPAGPSSTARPAGASSTARPARTPPSARPSAPSRRRDRPAQRRSLQATDDAVQSARPDEAKDDPGAVVENLMLQADVARLSGHPEAAVAPLRRVLRDHADDPRAPLAAVTLGRLQMDQLQAPERALHTLELALELGVPAALRPDVEARVSRLRALVR